MWRQIRAPLHPSVTGFWHLFEWLPKRSRWRECLPEACADLAACRPRLSLISRHGITGPKAKFNYAAMTVVLGRFGVRL